MTAIAMRARLGAAKVRARLTKTPLYRSHSFEATLRSELLPCDAALFDRDQLERVNGTGFSRSFASELDKLTATTFSEVPLTSLTVSDAIVEGHHVFSKEGIFNFPRPAPSKLINSLLGKKETVSFDSVTLLNSFQGLAYFGHWLGDDVAAYEAVRKSGELVSLPRPPWPDAAFYEAVFDQNWRELSRVRARRLTLVRDLGFSRDKGARLAKMRERLAAHFLDSGGSEDIVYITRGRNGEKRSVSNEDALLRELSNSGCRIVAPEESTVRHVAQLQKAKVVIGVEGSQLRHALMSLRSSGKLLVIQPPQRFYNPHHEWARLLGIRSGIVIGKQTGTEEFSVSPAEVLEMIALLLRTPDGIQSYLADPIPFEQP